MNVYSIKNAFENIRVWFSRPVVGAQVGPNAQEDAKMLASMSREACFMCARNGRHYWYCFPHTPAYMDVVKYLLKRNGAKKVSVHWSRYCSYKGKRRLALRLPKSYLLKNPSVENFLRSVNNVSELYSVPHVNEQLPALRAQMFQKQK